jgi:predicted GNAT family N-acyltransferase
VLIRVDPPRTGPDWWLWRQVEDLQQKVYGEVASHDQSLSPVTYAWLQGQRVVATLDVLSKEISHAGHDYRASGLSWVLTDPEARHHGHGRDLVSAVRNELSRQPVDLVIFTCDTPLRAFYESAGFEQLPGTVIVGGVPDQPFPSDQPGFDKVTMAALLSPRAKEAHAGFAHARIPLYPGTTDKLW